MDQNSKVKRPPNPYNAANIFSKIMYAYTLPLFYKAFTKKIINEEDIPEILDCHKASFLGNTLEKYWIHQQSKNKPLLWIALCRAFGLEFLGVGLMFVMDFLAIRILLMHNVVQLVRYYARDDKGTANKYDAYMYGGFVIVYLLIGIFLCESSLTLLRLFAMKVRVACSSLIYRKSLKLRKTVLQEIGVGHITNLLSNDVARFDRAVLYFHFFWISPIQIIEILFILYALVGITSAIGIIFMILWYPLFVMFGRKCSELRDKTALKTDLRVQLMKEIIDGIKVIKMYAWEKPFTILVENIRREEIQQIEKINICRGLIRLAYLIPKIAIFLTIVTYVLTGYNITAGYVFAITCYFELLNHSLIICNIMAVQYFSELFVTIKRVEELLLQNEKKPVTSVQTNNPAIVLEEITARWSKLPNPTLHQITLTVKNKEFVGIVGSMGSGKSSVLQVILKELPVESGSLDVHGTISYASQDPWIFSANVQQNILFGQPMNLKRYNMILNACALEHDLALLPYGDKTLVGDRGVNLSGGQKARISLARALYIKSDIYLLDEPFSALDVEVANHVFHNCFKYILREKCVLLVTHHLEYLHSSNRLYILNNGRVSDSCNYKNIAQSLFSQQNNYEIESEKHRIQRTTQKPEKEYRNSGIVSKGVYIKYITAGGSTPLCFVVALLFFVVKVISILVEYFPTYWVNNNNVSEVSFGPDVFTDRNVIIYTGLVLMVCIFTVIRTRLYIKMTTNISIRLHSEMFKNLLNAPMSFFWTNSTGRILNRFSKDLGVVDENIPISLMDVLQILMLCFGSFAMICVTNPWLIVVSIVFFMVYYFWRVIYLTTSHNLYRINGTAQSPLYGHLNDSLQGLVTVRACHNELILQEEFDKHLDFYSSVRYLFITCSRTFSFYMELVFFFYVAAVVLSILLDESVQSAANAGLAIMQAIFLLGMFHCIILLANDLENKMTCAERAIEYTQHPSEHGKYSTPPPSNWPQHGSISFQSLFLKYAENQPYALKNLNFTIEAFQKIGVVGRTGAGKSSLIVALFQLSKIDGGLYIDNIDVTQVPPQSLRSKISIIPQDPFLFSGTIRQNLDPFGSYSEEDLWSSLTDVQLKDTVSSLPMGLDYIISKDGANFSVGQRQLMCLARAILGKNVIIVLDEATANVDPQNSALIQTIIKKKFVNTTVLTISHRIENVIESDKVLVIDEGEIKEYDHPYLLLQNKNGLFYTMVYKSGNSTAEQLTAMAKYNYRKMVPPLAV